MGIQDDARVTRRFGTDGNVVVGRKRRCCNKKDFLSSDEGCLLFGDVLQDFPHLVCFRGLTTPDTRPALITTISKVVGWKGTTDEIHGQSIQFDSSYMYRVGYCIQIHGLYVQEQNTTTSMFKNIVQCSMASCSSVSRYRITSTTTRAMWELR
jgi:hypothetical protein